MILQIKGNNCLVFVLLALAVFIVYGNALFNGFVYDDGYLILRNELIGDLKNLPLVFVKDVTELTPVGRASGYYRPVSMAFLMMVRQVAALNAFGWHLVNVLLHLVNTFLVFLLIRDCVRDRTIAFFGALLFAVHPVHVEAVTPVYNFMGLLSAFFGLRAMIAFFKSEGFTKKPYTLLCLLMLALAVFAKEEMIVLPGLFLLAGLYFFRHGSVRRLMSRSWAYGLCVAVAALYVWARVSVVEKEAALGFWDLPLHFNVLPAGSAALHFMTVLKIYCHYVILLIFPMDLSAFHMVYPAQGIVRPESLACLGVTGLLFSFAFMTRRRRPAVSFWILFFFISLVPVSNLFPIGGLFAERFLYFPSVAFCALAGTIFVRSVNVLVPARKEFHQRLILYGIFIVVIVFGFKTARRNYVWRNDVILWEETWRDAPRSLVVNLNLANAYFRHGRLEEAQEAYLRALSFNSARNFAVHNALGKIAGIQGNEERALMHFGIAVSLNPGFVEGHYNIGITHFHLGHDQLALAYFHEAVLLDEEYPWSYYGMGMVYEKRGEAGKARMLFERALRLDPHLSAAREALERMNEANSLPRH